MIVFLYYATKVGLFFCIFHYKSGYYSLSNSNDINLLKTKVEEQEYIVLKNFYIVYFPFTIYMVKLFYSYSKVFPQI